MDYYDLLLASKLSGGGSSVTVESLSVTQNGTYTADTGKAYSPVEVNVQPPQEAEIKDVNFFDYDGTCLYSYTKAEWANVTELPPNPSHDKLTAQGWNWTKAEINTQLANVPDCPVIVGQHYISASGDTEIDIELIAPRLSPYLGIALNGSVEVDWGDGSAKETISATNISNLKNTQHQYSSSGSYTIKIHRISGSYTTASQNPSNSRPVLNNAQATMEHNYVYMSAIKDIRLGDMGEDGGVAGNSFNGLEAKSIPIPKDIKEYTNGFNGARFEYLTVPRSHTNQTESFPEELHTISLPPTTTSLYFYGKYYLRNVTFIYGASIPSLGFRNCYELRKALIPSNATAIEGSSFRACYSLATITVPSGVTSIGAIAFGDCKGLGEIHMLPETPPTIANNDALNTIPSDCVIYVPSAKLSDYQTASIWSNYSSQMVGE